MERNKGNFPQVSTNSATLILSISKCTCHISRRNKSCVTTCTIFFQTKIWSSHLLDNLSNCLMHLKDSGDSTGFEPMTSVIPVQCSNQLSYEVTQPRTAQFVGLMFSRKRNVVWKKCYMKCGVWKYKYPNKLTCCQLCEFVVQLVRALHRHHRGRGFESCWVTWFFQVHETIA